MTIAEFKQSIIDQYNATGVICEDEIRYAYEEAELPEEKYDKVLREIGSKIFIDGPIREIDEDEMKMSIVPEKNKDYYATSEYLKQIARYPKYPKEKELELARIMNDETKSEKERMDARDKIICSNLRYVPYLASKYRNGAPFMDLIQVGNLALMKCLKTFDPDKDCAVVTYASWWIKLAIRNEAFSHNNMISLPTSIRKYIATVKEMADKKRAANESFQFNDLLKECGAPRHIWPTIKMYLHQMVSLQAEIKDKNGSSDGETSTVGDFVPDENTNIEHEVETKMASEWMDKLLEIIPKKRDRDIIIMRLGLDGNPPMTLSEIGKALNPPITRERVRQIFNMKLNALRRSELANDLKEMWEE